VDVQDCVFCKIIAGQIPCLKIYENDHVLAFLDVGPVSDGHTLLVPKQHCTRIDQASDGVMIEIAKVLPAIAGGVRRAMDAEGYNVLCNNGHSAGQIVDHMHFHIIPRNPDDGVFNRWPSYQYPETKPEGIAAKIRENISL